MTLDAAHRLANAKDVTFAHCDARVLHAPGSGCEFCDDSPERQVERLLCGVAFSGEEPGNEQVACPADRARPVGSDSDYRLWPGNTREGYAGSWVERIRNTILARVRREGR